MVVESEGVYTTGLSPQCSEYLLDTFNFPVICTKKMQCCHENSHSWSLFILPLGTLSIIYFVVQQRKLVKDRINAFMVRFRYCRALEIGCTKTCEHLHHQCDSCGTSHYHFNHIDIIKHACRRCTNIISQFLLLSIFSPWLLKTFLGWHPRLLSVRFCAPQHNLY